MQSRRKIAVRDRSRATIGSDMTKLDHERLKRRLQPKELGHDDLPPTGSFADRQRQESNRSNPKQSAKTKVLGTGMPAFTARSKGQLASQSAMRARPTPDSVTAQVKAPLEKVKPAGISSAPTQEAVLDRRRQICPLCGRSVIHMKTHRLRAHKGTPQNL